MAILVNGKKVAGIGQPGKSAYQTAVEGGYTGSESEFNQILANAATTAYVDAAKPLLRTADLTTSGWSSNVQTVTVNGVVADPDAQLIYVSPADKVSAAAWGAAGVFCLQQDANLLAFVCDTAPTDDISVYISIQEAQT